MQPDTNTSTQPPTEQLPQIVERVNAANNVLITVSNNPSVDQLAACIGLTIALNKQGKHATAVYSGKTPSTIEFLEPERTIETNTNSLRDFIISLDKSKADKLRYKVEDEFVKIFITPYRTSIDENDLAFTQGDFNIDLIITLGVHERAHLDAAIVAHGRILHDAAVVSLNTDTTSEVGTINWVAPDASSLCEMTSDMLMLVNKDIFDSQIATALLTGMVAETNRFGNEKAHPHTMSISGVLMAAGASPQLISAKLSEPLVEEPSDEIPAVVEDGEYQQPEDDGGNPDDEPPLPKNNDGMIQIDHTQEDDILIDEHGKLQAVKDLEVAQAALEEEAARTAEAREQTQNAAEQSDDSSAISGYDLPGEPQASDGKQLVTDPPQLGGQLTANSVPEYEQLTASTDPLSAKAPTPIIERQDRHMAQEPSQPVESIDLLQPNDQTLTDIEKAVDSPHLHHQNGSVSTDLVSSVPPPPPIDDARAAVEQAVDSTEPYRPEPISALGASPVDLDLGHSEPGSTTQPTSDDNSDDNDDDKPKDDQSTGPMSTPPPVPPPLMPLGS